MRQAKPGASSGCNSRPGKGNEPPHRESSLGLMEVTTWAKRRQSDRRAVTQGKRLSLVRDYPRADGVEYSEGNSRPPLMARWSETAAGSESTARPETEASRNLRDPVWSRAGANPRPEYVERMDILRTANAMLEVGPADSTRSAGKPRTGGCGGANRDWLRATSPAHTEAGGRCPHN